MCDFSNKKNMRVTAVSRCPGFKVSLLYFGGLGFLSVHVRCTVTGLFWVPKCALDSDFRKKKIGLWLPRRQCTNDQRKCNCWPRLSCKLGTSGQCSMFLAGTFPILGRKEMPNLKYTASERKGQAQPNTLIRLSQFHLNLREALWHPCLHVWIGWMPKIGCPIKATT